MQVDAIARIRGGTMDRHRVQLQTRPLFHTKPDTNVKEFHDQASETGGEVHDDRNGSKQGTDAFSDLSCPLLCPLNKFPNPNPLCVIKKQQRMIVTYYD